jgi:hypothetical protein
MNHRLKPEDGSRNQNLMLVFRDVTVTHNLANSYNVSMEPAASIFKAEE